MFLGQSEDAATHEVVFLDEPHRSEALPLPHAAVILGGFHGHARHFLNVELHDLHRLFDYRQDGSYSFFRTYFDPVEIGVGLAVQQPLFTNAVTILLYQTFEPFHVGWWTSRCAPRRRRSQLLLDFLQSLTQRAFDFV